MTQKRTQQDLRELAQKRNHTLISAEGYTSVHSLIKIRCETCKNEWETKAHSYINAKKTGCPECKKVAISNVHQGKTVSPATRAKISAQAQGRPGSLTGVTGPQHPAYKGGYGRDLKNPSTKDYVWKNGVRERCNYTCVITGEKNKNNGPGFACHHLESYNTNPSLRYDIENGVYLKKEIHQHFHKLYKSGNNTEEQFAEYCKVHHDFDWNERKRELNL